MLGSKFEEVSIFVCFSTHSRAIRDVLLEVEADVDGVGGCAREVEGAKKGRASGSLEVVPGKGHLNVRQDF